MWVRVLGDDDDVKGVEKYVCLDVLGLACHA